MGSTHARAYAKLPDVRVVGVSSLDPEEASELASEVSAEHFTDAYALATDPRVDAVSITLPTHLHKEYAIQALEAGKHVFVEKPMSLSVEDCDRMIEAAQKNARLLMVAHVLRFWPEYVALAEVVHSGELGRPIAATAFRLSAKPRWGKQNWFANPAFSGGAVFDMQVHDVDALNWICGDPVSVYSRGDRGDGGGWDHVQTLIDYGGATGFAEDSVLMPVGYPFYQALKVLCERGSIEYTFRAASARVETNSSTGSELVVYPSGAPSYPVDTADGDAYENEVAYFVDCVLQSRAPERCTADQGRLAIQTVSAARESLTTNGVVLL
jgi:predicted dehydrogenase